MRMSSRRASAWDAASNPCLSHLLLFWDLEMAEVECHTTGTGKAIEFSVIISQFKLPSLC